MPEQVPLLFGSGMMTLQDRIKRTKKLPWGVRIGKVYINDAGAPIVSIHIAPWRLSLWVWESRIRRALRLPNTNYTRLSSAFDMAREASKRG
jgi:hypothetical protein